MTVEGMRQAFLALPDTVVITDVYWYILDFNRTAPFGQLRKGVQLTHYLPECATAASGEHRREGSVHRWHATAVRDRGEVVGHAVYLVDITRQVALVEERRRRSAQLEELTAAQREANARLGEYVRQAEALTAYSDQLRIARTIHNGAGHSITALHAVSQMCLQLMETDPVRYGQLLDEGIALCERARTGTRTRPPASLRELFADFERECLFPVAVSVRGEEAPFVAALYGLIADICKEAYHNTLSHSLAESLSITVDASPERLQLDISDDGRFRGRSCRASA